MTSASVDEWLRALPDLPRHVELRSMVLHGQATLLGAPDAGLVLRHDGTTGGFVGEPLPDVFEEARPALSRGAELLAMPETIGLAVSLVPGCVARRAILLETSPVRGVAPAGGIEVSQVDEEFVSSLPSELAEEAEHTFYAAVRRVGGDAVAMCATASMTESLWDAGVDTLEGHRRQGHARACFEAMDRHMSGLRLRPVWGAYEDNEASLGMAASLGFTPTDEIWVIEVPWA